MKYALEGTGVVEVKKLSFDLIKRGDLIFFEGPVLSHFIDEHGDDYFMRWCEMDESANRWLLLQISKEQLIKHLSGKTSFLSLIKRTESGAVYFLDIDNNIDYKHIKHVEVGRIPEQYLPEKDSYFEMKYGTEYALQLEAEIKDLLKKQKKLPSFWEIATVNLFGKHSIENKLAARHSTSCYLHDPSHFPEQYVLSLIDFPLLLHRHANKTTYIEDFFRKNTHTTSAMWSRLQMHEPKYGSSFVSNFSFNDLSAEELSVLVNYILESARNIVHEHPDEYLSLYEQWKKLLVRNLTEINTIDRVLQDKFAHDEEDDLITR
jgi:hypothetical protein